MTQQQIAQLIEKAKGFAENSFVPLTEDAVGACALTAENILFGGCTIETAVPSASVGAAAVAILKAVSEGGIEIKAVCIYKAEKMPYLSGLERDIMVQFGKSALVILACDEKYETYRVYELMPFSMEDR